MKKHLENYYEVLEMKDKSDKLKLTFEQIDYLKELGNIGSGNAAVALSKLLNKRIDVSLTSFEIIPFWELPERFGGRGERIFGIYSIINGIDQLSILQIFTIESIVNLINILNEEKEKKILEINNLEELDEYSLSIISETGNILAGHYASSLADLMSTKLIPEVPDVAFDSIGAILDGILATSSELIDVAILMRTNLEINELNLKSTLTLFPSVNALKKLIDKLNSILDKL